MKQHIRKATSVAALIAFQSMGLASWAMAENDPNEANVQGDQKSSQNFFRKLNKAEDAPVDDKAYFDSTALWPASSIAICWENPSDDNYAERMWVEQAAQGSWQAVAAIKFTGWQPCISNNRGIRILIEDSGPHVKALGHRLDGIRSGMVLNFSFKNWSNSCADTDQYRELCIRSITVHEFGHALGFAHEQNRPDTPGECAFQRQGSDGNRHDITPWDIESVMNYCNPIYNNNGELSDLDIKAVQYFYGEK